MLNEVILMWHTAVGVIGVLAAVWLFVEALNAAQGNQDRVRFVSLVSAVCIWASYIVGGYWYVKYYSVDKALIKAGPWPFAHGFVMETKEHVFLLLLLIATFLPIAAYSYAAGREGARKVVLWTSAFVVVIGLAMEGAGAMISMGAKVALLAK